jgi:hypothetical protein
LPFDENDITGYYGDNVVSDLSQEQIDEIAARYKRGDDVPPSALINAIRSIKPGVYMSGTNPDEQAGQITEVIINVPCKMTRIGHLS